MREIVIGGQTFRVRGLRLAEIAGGLRRLGYGRFSFAPEGDLSEERISAIMDAALECVLGREGVAAVDEAGGVKGLSAAWRAILEETYGTPETEKNSAAAGSGSATPGGASTAASAADPPPPAPAANTA